MKGQRGTSNLGFYLRGKTIWSRPATKKKTKACGEKGGKRGKIRHG